MKNQEVNLNEAENSSGWEGGILNNYLGFRTWFWDYRLSLERSAVRDLIKTVAPELIAAIK